MLKIILMISIVAGCAFAGKYTSYHKSNGNHHNKDVVKRSSGDNTSNYNSTASSNTNSSTYVNSSALSTNSSSSSSSKSMSRYLYVGQR